MVPVIRPNSSTYFEAELSGTHCNGVFFQHLQYFSTYVFFKIFRHVHAVSIGLISAPSVQNVQLAIEHIYPLVSKYRMEDKRVKQVEMTNSKMHLMPTNRSRPGPGRFRRQGRVSNFS